MPTLTRSELAACFRAVQKVKLEPSDFKWSVDATIAADTLPVDLFEHLPTRSYFGVRFANRGGYWISHWPALREEAATAQGVPSWPLVLSVFTLWLAKVTDDHNTPDVWGAVSKQSTIPEAAVGTAHEMTFTLAEVKLLREKLDDIQQFILTTQPPLPPEDVAQVKRRFDYLKTAATTTARKIDWLNIFVGQVFNMMTSGLMSPTIYQPVMAHATTVLQTVFQFAVKLLTT